jgi:hypothetical protein
MRIKDLLENAHFKSEEFVKQTDDGNEIDYDLTDDLVFFLNNDDDAYRRYLLPAVHKFIDKQQAGEEPKYTIFKTAVADGYKQYTKEYPMRELPNEIDTKNWKSACKQLFDTVSKDMEDGTYDHD